MTARARHLAAQPWPGRRRREGSITASAPPGGAAEAGAAATGGLDDGERSASIATASAAHAEKLNAHTNTHAEKLIDALVGVVMAQLQISVANAAKHALEEPLTTQVSFVMCPFISRRVASAVAKLKMFVHTAHTHISFIDFQ